ncbi:MAG: hypothetical protein U5K72_07940 [Balneolaceae bacterium]|nr:hypothetical protein [Balneolaceae bacterium]
MDSKDIRELQAPLKKTYKENPEAALVTLKASGKLDEWNFLQNRIQARRW